MTTATNMLNKLIQIIKEDVIGNDNHLIAAAWLACLAGILGLGVYLGSESMSFMGVADSRELQVNFEYPVSVKRVHVIPGQHVERGELLVELDQSELNTQIRTLQGTISRLEAELKVRDRLNSIVGNKGVSDLSDPVSIEIADLSKELEYLENQKNNLFVFAEVSGIVGAVNFKKGEKAPAFSALVTLSPASPTYVQGFIHESMKTKLEIGREVDVRPLSSDIEPLVGHVVAVGSRFVPMAQRLGGNPNFAVWGREVVVELPPGNQLLLGEKVQLKPKFDLISFPMALAKDEPPTTQNHDQSLFEIQLPRLLAKHNSFEPSGLVYLKDLRKFAVVSDDTDKNDTPYLFLMNADGQVEEQPLLIPGINKVGDLESISQEGSSLYVLSSQGLTKKGKSEFHRNLLVRTKRSGLGLSDTKSVELKPMLIKALELSKDAEIKRIFPKVSAEQFEIESHFVDGGDLYLGFKAPLDPANKSVILKISDVDALFTADEIPTSSLKVWKSVKFENRGQVQQLTDLALVEGDLFASTSCDEAKCGAVWRLDEAGEAELVASYQKHKPEGIGYDPTTSTIVVTFDLKNETAKFARIGLKPKKLAANGK